MDNLLSGVIFGRIARSREILKPRDPCLGAYLLSQNMVIISIQLQAFLSMMAMRE